MISKPILQDKGVNLGTFSGDELTKILSKLALKASTGEITIENLEAPLKSIIVLKEGRIARVISDLLKYRIGDLLVKRKLITPQNLSEALNIQTLRKDHPMLGEVLISLNLVTENQINEALFRQYEYVFYETLFFNKAAFYFRHIGKAVTDLKFSDQDLAKQVMTKFTLSLSHFGDKYFPVMKLMREKIPSLEHIPKKENDIDYNKLTNEHKELLEYIDGSNTLTDILLLSNIDYFGIYVLIYQLFTLNVIKFLPPKEEIKKEDISKEVKKEKEEIKETQPIIKSPPIITPCPQISELPINIKEQLQKYEILTQIFNDKLIDKMIKLPFNKKQLFSKVIENILDLI